MNNADNSSDTVSVKYEQICDTGGFCLIKIISNVETKIDPSLDKETIIEEKNNSTSQNSSVLQDTEKKDNSSLQDKTSTSISKSSQKIKIRSGFRGSKK
jgi:hypothetical protein